MDRYWGGTTMIVPARDDYRACAFCIVARPRQAGGHALVNKPGFAGRLFVSENTKRYRQRVRAERPRSWATPRYDGMTMDGRSIYVSVRPCINGYLLFYRDRRGQYKGCVRAGKSVPDTHGGRRTLARTAATTNEGSRLARPESPPGGMQIAFGAVPRTPDGRRHDCVNESSKRRGDVDSVLALAPELPHSISRE